MTTSSNYMGAGFAQTYDHKTSKPMQGLGNGFQAANSATSLTLSNYAVPSLDGKLVPALPIKIALKYGPPTIAVIYEIKGIKDKKSGKTKKFIHDIQINFDD